LKLAYSLLEKEISLLIFFWHNPKETKDQGFRKQKRYPVSTQKNESSLKVHDYLLYYSYYVAHFSSCLSPFLACASVFLRPGYLTRAVAGV
jgi:hypothetical protein